MTTQGYLLAIDAPGQIAEVWRDGSMFVAVYAEYGAHGPEIEDRRWFEDYPDARNWADLRMEQGKRLVSCRHCGTNGDHYCPRDIGRD